MPLNRIRAKLARVHLILELYLNLDVYRYRRPYSSKHHNRIISTPALV